MRNVLHIIEIAPHVHAGFVNKRAEIEGDMVNTPEGWRQLSIPSGGVSFLFNKIYEYGFKDRMVFVADRYPDKKKAMYPDYKSNRDHSEEKYDQMRLAEIVLEDCGFQVLYEEGYESDDIVYSLVNKYKKSFDKVYVHTGDSDLYICVDNNVEILPSSSRSKHITRENYETHAVKDSIVPFNSLSFSKVLYGDTSDTISPLPEPLREKLRRMFYHDFYYERMSDKMFMRTLIESLVPEALSQFDVVYPLDVDAEIDLSSEPNLTKTQIWGKLVGNNRFPRVGTIPDNIKSVISDLFSEEAGFIKD